MPTLYGQMLVNRFDINQTTALVQTFSRLDYAVYDYEGDLVCMPRDRSLPGLNIELPALA